VSSMTQPRAGPPGMGRPALRDARAAAAASDRARSRASSSWHPRPGARGRPDPSRSPGSAHLAHAPRPDPSSIVSWRLKSPLQRQDGRPGAAPRAVGLPARRAPRATRGYQPRWASSCSFLQLGDSRDSSIRPRRGARRLRDARPRPASASSPSRSSAARDGGSERLEDAPSPRTTPFRAQRHHQRGVRRRRDAPRAEQDHGQGAASRRKLRARGPAARRGPVDGRRQRPPHASECRPRRISRRMESMWRTASTMSPVPARPWSGSSPAPPRSAAAPRPRFVARRTRTHLNSHLSMWLASSAGVSTYRLRSM